MCGIAGRVSLTNDSVPALSESLAAMSRIIAHRGPDGQGSWMSAEVGVGLVHRRLAIVDLTDAAAQPMQAYNGMVLTYNGEIYNHVELRRELGFDWQFRTRSDTECILAAYERYGEDCVMHLRGMFAFALWDARRRKLFCARDPFGIKPFYYAIHDGVFSFASEAKALLPFLPSIDTDADALAEYLTFQYTLGEQTLFKGVRQLMPGHTLMIECGRMQTRQYWDVRYEASVRDGAAEVHQRLRALVEESIDLHGRSDVSVGSYVSGGVDSSLIYRLARVRGAACSAAFHGRFMEHPGYDESEYARAAAAIDDGYFHCVDIRAEDFRRNIGDVVRHLDFPVAGPGAFPQYMVSELASHHVKVVLGGQGGDEIFGGYARYLAAYLERSLKAAIEGVAGEEGAATLAALAPNLSALREYVPLLREFWREGLFASLDARYFRLIDRSTDMRDEIDWAALDMRGVFERFAGVFNDTAVQQDGDFDRMTRFDLKCLLPALLHVEDRMSMAHGIESRVPFLDVPLVEYVASLPLAMKFEGGRMKHLLKDVFAADLPIKILNRRDKMGFPVPLKEWFDGELREYVLDAMHSMARRHRSFVNGAAVLRGFGREARFSRKLWGLLSLELWHQQFHDRADEWRRVP